MKLNRYNQLTRKPRCNLSAKWLHGYHFLVLSLNSVRATATEPWVLLWDGTTGTSLLLLSALRSPPLRLSFSTGTVQRTSMSQHGSPLSSLLWSVSTFSQSPSTEKRSSALPVSRSSQLLDYSYSRSSSISVEDPHTTVSDSATGRTQVQ